MQFEIIKRQGEGQLHFFSASTGSDLFLKPESCFLICVVKT